MKTKWKCLKDAGCFTVGKIYACTPEGRLIDDDGDRRLRPEQYNRHYERECFIEIKAGSMFNK